MALRSSHPSHHLQRAVRTDRKQSHRRPYVGNVKTKGSKLIARVNMAQAIDPRVTPVNQSINGFTDIRPLRIPRPGTHQRIPAAFQLGQFHLPCAASQLPPSLRPRRAHQRRLGCSQHRKQPLCRGLRSHPALHRPVRHQPAQPGEGSQSSDRGWSLNAYFAKVARVRPSFAPGKTLDNPCKTASRSTSTPPPS